MVFRWAVVTAMAFAALTTGCGAVMNGARTTVAIASHPPGARVAIDGVPLASTPAEVSLDNDSDHLVQFTMPDGTHRYAWVRSRIHVRYVLLDVLAGPLAVVVDAVTDRWRVLSPRSVHVGFAGDPIHEPSAVVNRNGTRGPPSRGELGSVKSSP